MSTMSDDRDLAYAMYRHGDDTVDTIIDALRAAAERALVGPSRDPEASARFDALADDLAGGVAAIIDEGDDPDTYPVTVQVRRTLTTSHPHTPAGPVCVCDECGRVFDMQDEGDAGEWAYGHDCEVAA